VSNDKARTAFHQFRHGLLDKDFRAGIDGAGSFVQDQHLGIGQKGPRDRQKLFLPWEILLDSSLISVS